MFSADAAIRVAQLFKEVFGFGYRLKWKAIPAYNTEVKSSSKGMHVFAPSRNFLRGRDWTAI